MVFNSSLCFHPKPAKCQPGSSHRKPLGGRGLGFWRFGILGVWSFGGLEFCGLGVLELWSFRGFGVLSSFCHSVWGQPLGYLTAPYPSESHFAGMSSPGICWDGIFICGGTKKFVPDCSCKFCKFCKSTQSSTFPAQFLLCHIGQRLQGEFFIFLLKSGCSSPL